MKYERCNFTSSDISKLKRRCVWWLVLKTTNGSVKGFISSIFCLSGHKRDIFFSEMIQNACLPEMANTVFVSVFITVCCWILHVLPNRLWENWNKVQVQYKFNTSLLLYSTNIHTCIHKPISIIALNIVIQSAYIDKCNAHHQNVQHFSSELNTT